MPVGAQLQIFWAGGGFIQGLWGGGDGCGTGKQNREKEIQAGCLPPWMGLRAPAVEAWAVATVLCRKAFDEGRAGCGSPCFCSETVSLGAILPGVQES